MPGVFNSPGLTPNPQPGPTPPPTWASDKGFQEYVAKYGKNWDPTTPDGLSAGYRLYRAYKLGIHPDKAGHLPDHSSSGEPLKTYNDPNTVTKGVDNLTGYQVASPNYTGPLTHDIIDNAHKYFNAGTATRPFGAGGWDPEPGHPAGSTGPALQAPSGYTIPTDPSQSYIQKYGY